MNAEKITGYLQSQGIKPSHHRIQIYRYLMEKRNHPNVDMVFQELVKEIPTLSKTTVYNTMNLFLEKGAAIPIMIAENEMRYDADTSLHGHFLCGQCHNIYDLHMKGVGADFEGLDEFEIDESHVYFKGTCPACLAKRVGQ